MPRRIRTRWSDLVPISIDIDGIKHQGHYQVEVNGPVPSIRVFFDDFSTEANLLGSDREPLAGR